MTLRVFILMVLLCPAILPLYSQNAADEELLRIIRTEGQAQVSVPLTEAGRDLFSGNVSVVTIREGSVILRLSQATVGWFISKKMNYTIIPLIKPDLTVKTKGIGDWDTYPTFTQYDSIMRSFQSAYPDLCRLDTIGLSIYGKPVFVLKISDNVSVDEDEPGVFFSSSMHGDETAGFILMLRLCAYLLENNNNERIGDLTGNLQIWINPLANPDGMYRTGNVLRSPVRFNSNGVDLNRNFPDPALPGQVIQKENIDMIRFLGERRFVLSANFHSGAEVVNYPWDRQISRLHADDRWFYGISRAYADTVHGYSPPSYMNDFDNGVVRGAVWYQISGGRQDFITSELGGREVTIELDEQFITPPARLPDIWEYNYRSLIGYLENALYGIHGKVLDATTSDPVPARIFVEDHDYDSSHVFSDTLTGSFVRMLAAGTWDIAVSANGYRDTLITDVTVADRSRTDLTIYLEPGGDTRITAPLLWPNPAASVLKGILNARLTGIIKVEIVSLTGKAIRSYETYYSRSAPFETDVSSLPAGLYLIRFTHSEKGITSTGKFHVIR